MARPRRLYYNEKTNKYYYLINGKKIFIKVPAGMSQKQAQTINIKNIIQGDARRLKPKKKRVKAKYTKKLDKGMEKLQPSPFSTGRPTYYFQPPSSTTILERNIAKSDDTATNKLLELLLKGAKENIQLPEKPNIPLPSVESTPVKVEPETVKVAKSIKKTSYDDAMDFIEQRKLMEKTYEDIMKQKKQEIPADFFTAMKPEPVETPLPVEKPITTPYNLRQRKLDSPFTAIKPEPVEKPSTTPLEASRATQQTKEKRGELSYEPENFIKIVKKFGGRNVFNGIKNPKPKTNEDLDMKDLKQIKANLGLDEVEPGTSQKLLIDRILNALKKSKGKGCDCKKKKDDDGLYNDEIEEIMKKRIKNYVPVVPQDKVHTLLQYVNPNDKYFTAVVNTEPSHSSGRHWRCIFIDNRDDFQSAEYFDPLAETSKPESPLLEVMRTIAKKMNPEKYFKFKFNKLQRQSNNSSNCGFHVMQFIEDRVNGDDFETASGWKSYMKRKQQGKGIPDDIDGEKNVKPYQEMIEKKFSSYL